MARMEGFLLKKGWFNNWKSRYLTCSENILAIYKSEDKTKGREFNVMDCHIKRIDAKRWNKQFVFRVKVAGKRIYLAADDDTVIQNWITAIRGRVARASLLGANIHRYADGDKRRGSIMAPGSRGLRGMPTSFDVQAFPGVLSGAIADAADPEAQHRFSDICGCFLALAHGRSRDMFNNAGVPTVDGLIVKAVEISERRMYKDRIRGIARAFAKKVPGIVLPLQCLVDFGGCTLFFESASDGRKEISPENAQKVSALGLGEKAEVFQDSQGNPWVVDVGASETGGVSEAVVEEFAHALDAMDVFVFDSQSLVDMMKLRGIPVSKLPKIADIVMIPGIRVLLQTEMIARAAKSIISERLTKVASTEWTVEIVKLFDQILGNSAESDQFWKTTLAPTVEKKFGIEVTKQLPLLHMAQLFFSLQFHTGADFKDIADYDFKQEHPVELEHMSAIHAVPHHCLAEVCTVFRNIHRDPYRLLIDGFSNQASIALNNRVSMFQSVYGDDNAFVASGMALLSQSYIGIGDAEKATQVARVAIKAGRQFHAALIPAYLTLITTAEKDQLRSYVDEAMRIVSFQLSNSHWFAADILMASASAQQRLGFLSEAVDDSKRAMELVNPLLGAGHPKTARCALLQGKIQRVMGHFGVAEPIVQQALYSMTSAFTSESVQVAECEYELADVLLDSGKAQAAEVVAKKALETRQKKFESDAGPVMASVQQLALIYDSLGDSESAFVHYRVLINFLKSLEDESVFGDMLKVVRNVLCLLFRSLPASQRRIINQVKRCNVTNDAMKETLEQLIEIDTVEEIRGHLAKYEETGDVKEFDTVACTYHIATGDMSWIELEENTED